MTMFLTIAVIVLIFVVIFQIAKASEYVSVLKGEETSRKQNNKINGFLMVVFLVVGMIGVWYCNKLYFHKTLLAVDSGSVEGARVDSMLWITIAVTGIVFILTQAVLFWFAYQIPGQRPQSFLFPAQQ
jgi:cytochrome c oxidase subunit 2